MPRGFSLSIAVILLLSSAGFAAIGPAHGHALVGPGRTVTVGHCQPAYSYYHCGTVGLGQQTWMVGCHYRVIRWFCWWPCKPACRPPSEPGCIAEGGDATATANAVSYGGDADATALAAGGNATSVIAGRPSSAPRRSARGGDATATATAVSYGGHAHATAHAVGGDAICQ
jgi:hypothetical protein